MPRKTALHLTNFVDECKIMTRSSWRWHSDQGSEFAGDFDKFLRDHVIVKTDTGGYDSAATDFAEILSKTNKEE